MENYFEKIKGVVCEFEPGEKVYFTLEGLEKEPRDSSDSDLNRHDRFFRKIMADRFSSYIPEEANEEGTYIDMTDAVNQFYADNNNPEHHSGRHDQFVSRVYNNLGLAVVAYGGVDFDESVGCINSKGEYAIPRQYEIGMEYGDGLFATYNDSLVGGYINTKNETVIPFQFGVVGKFNNGYACVYTRDHEIHFIDKSGRPVMKIKDLYRANTGEIYGETLEELKENVLKRENTELKTK